MTFHWSVSETATTWTCAAPHMLVSMGRMKHSTIVVVDAHHAPEDPFVETQAHLLAGIETKSIGSRIEFHEDNRMKRSIRADAFFNKAGFAGLSGKVGGRRPETRGRRWHGDPDPSACRGRAAPSRGSKERGGPFRTTRDRPLG